MPINVRLKGKKWERAVAEKLRPLFGARVKRGYQTRDGREAPDVDGTPFWVECKHGALVNLRAALAQAISATDGRPPVVIAKDTGRSAVVLMRLEDWLALVEREMARLVVTGLEEASGEENREEAAHAAGAAEEGGTEEEGA